MAENRETIATEVEYGVVKVSNVNKNYEGTEHDGYAVSPKSFKLTVADTHSYGVTKQATIQDLREGTEHTGFSVSPLTLSRYKADNTYYGIVKLAPDKITNYNDDVLKTTHYKDLQQSIDLINKNMGALGTPIGMLGLFPKNNAPEGWILADGSWHLKDVLKDLYNYLGASYSVSNTHFKTPNYSGYFLRGYDPNSSVDPDGRYRAWDVEQGDAIRNIRGQVGGLPTWSGTWKSGALERYDSGSVAGGPFPVGASEITFDASRTVPTSSENRPRNKIVAVYIRAFSPESIHINNIKESELLRAYNDLSRRVKNLEDERNNVNYSFNGSEEGWYTDTKSGFTIQWGVASRTGNQTVVDYPIEFTRCFNVMITQNTPASIQSGSNMTVVSYNNKNATFGTLAPENRFMWTAIGEIR